MVELKAVRPVQQQPLLPLPWNVSDELLPQQTSMLNVWELPVIVERLQPVNDGDDGGVLLVDPMIDWLLLRQLLLSVVAVLDVSNFGNWQRQLLLPLKLPVAIVAVELSPPLLQLT